MHWLEAFVPLRVHVLVRFGRWDDLIAEPLPADTDLYCTTAATIHYGRGVAHASKGQLPRARAERDAFTAAYDRIPDTRYLFNNTSRDILAIAAEMLDGEIAYREGEFERFRTSAPRDRTRRCSPLRRTVGLDAADPHAYGALLLEQGRVEDAAEVYAADLGLNPTLSRLHTLPTCGACTATTNASGGWAALPRRSQQLALAQARADVPAASYACRLEAG